MRQRNRVLAGVMGLIFFAAMAASGFAQEKAQAQDEEQVRIALAAVGRRGHMSRFA